MSQEDLKIKKINNNPVLKREDFKEQLRKEGECFYEDDDGVWPCSKDEFEPQSLGLIFIRTPKK